MAEPADINVDELRRRARRRLVGAVVLALGVAVVVPMLLETEQKPLGEDVSVKIPPVDGGKFVNRLNDAATKSDAASGGARPDDAKGESSAASPPANAPPPRTQKYDTHVPDAGAEAKPASNANAATPGGPAASESTAATEAAPAKSAADTMKAQPAPAHEPADRAKTAAASEAPKPSHASEAPQPAHAADAAHAPGAAAREGYAVQLAAFADDRGASSLAGRLKKAGYAAYTEPLKTSKGTLWRVRVGPYSSREAAVAARDKLKTEGQSGIVAAIK